MKVKKYSQTTVFTVDSSQIQDLSLLEAASISARDAFANELLKDLLKSTKELPSDYACQNHCRVPTEIPGRARCSECQDTFITPIPLPEMGHGL